MFLFASQRVDHEMGFTGRKVERASGLAVGVCIGDNQVVVQDAWSRVLQVWL